MMWYYFYICHQWSLTNQVRKGKVKKNQIELLEKNTIYEIGNTLGRLKSKLRAKINEPEDIAIDTLQTEVQREKNPKIK